MTKALMPCTGGDNNKMSCRLGVEGAMEVVIGYRLPIPSHPWFKNTVLVMVVEMVAVLWGRKGYVQHKPHNGLSYGYLQYILLN